MTTATDSIIAAIQSASFTKDAIRANLKPFIGQPGESAKIHFGSIPTDQLQVEANEGVITKIRWWSGLKWTARGGYGSTPSVEVE